MYDWCYSVEDTGAINGITWTPDNCAFVVGWKLRGNHPELMIDIETILNELSYDKNSYNEEKIRAMIWFNWCKSFDHCLLRGMKESKLGMIKMLAQLQLDDNRREALIHQNVIDALQGMSYTAC